PLLHAHDSNDQSGDADLDVNLLPPTTALASTSHHLTNSERDDPLAGLGDAYSLFQPSVMPQDANQDFPTWDTYPTFEQQSQMTVPHATTLHDATADSANSSNQPFSFGPDMSDNMQYASQVATSSAHTLEQYVNSASGEPNSGLPGIWLEFEARNWVVEGEHLSDATAPAKELK
ncbi:hypothetical protein FRC07_004420, partial [Ceratobasidium sp. 392]